MKVKFIKSPTGLFRLAYTIGDIADLPDEMANEIISMKFGEMVEAKKKKK